MRLTWSIVFRPQYHGVLVARVVFSSASVSALRCFWSSRNLHMTKHEARINHVVCSAQLAARLQCWHVCCSDLRHSAATHPSSASRLSLHSWLLA